MQSTQPIFKDSQAAFNAAIAAGVLSANKCDANYAGNYMYMYTLDGRDVFKHIMTRTHIWN